MERTRFHRPFTLPLVVVAVAVAVTPVGNPVNAASQSQGAAEILEVPRTVLDRIHFRSIGPSRQGGRIMDLAVPDPHKQPYTFYAAASTGGLWRTDDDGVTWTPIYDDVPINSLGDIEVSHSNPDVIYAGTGNASYWGEGIYRTDDGGATWQHRGLTNSLYIPRLRIHPDDHDVVWVAATGGHDDQSPERGVFRTTDGGLSWDRTLALRHDRHEVGAADLVVDPGDPDVLYASAWDATDGGGSGIYKSVDGGRTWSRLEGGLPQEPMDRIGLDIHHADPRTLVASILLTDPDWNGRSPYDRFHNTVWRSDDAGQTWRRISPPRTEYALTGASRFGQIRIDPQDPGRIYVLNTGVQGTPDGGTTWQKMIRFGGDNQAMWIDPRGTGRILMGYDYGLAISHSNGETWYHPDNLALGQVEAVGVDMARPYNVYGGMQDFGTWRGPSTKPGRWPIRFEDWEHVSGADGSYAQIDPTDNRWLYVESQRGEITRNDQRTGVRRRIRYEAPGIRFNFIAPILISPHNPDVLFHGANVLLRSSFRGEGWEPISHDLSEGGGAFSTEGRDVNGTISSFDESPLEQGVIWAGTDNGNLWLTRNSGDTWERVSEAIDGWPGAKVTRVEASNHWPGTAYVTASKGHRDRRDLRPYVFRTDDYGATWRSLAANLPSDEPVNVIREDHRNSRLLFAGTAKSIYVSVDGGASWASLRNNMPNVPIHDLVIHPRDNDLVVGTYGRSFWIADISPLQEIDGETLARDVHVFDIAPQVLWISARQTQVAAAFQNYNGENAPKGAVIHYLLGHAAEAVTIRVLRHGILVNEFAGTRDMGLNAVQWYLTERVPRSEEDKLEWDEWREAVLTEEEYFDYYDGTDHFGAADDEVSVFGRPLDVWVHPRADGRERSYKHIRARPGVYTVEVVVDGTVIRRRAHVLADEWFDRTY